MAEKSAYRSAFRHRRCLVPADGFYEWAKANGAKQPHYFQLRDDGPFAFASLWERWAKGEKPIESCTLLTTEANEVVSPVHDRMPIILEPKNYGGWLDPQRQRLEDVSAILRPFRPSAWLPIRWGDGSTIHGTMTRGASSRQHRGCDQACCVQSALT